jgi:FixJ family two-component response regulator
MPGMGRPQQNLKAGVTLPVIFLSGADVPNAVRAVKEGAIDFIEPFDYKQVVSLVHDCIARESARVQRERRRTLSAWRSSRSASAKCRTSWSPARPTATSPRRWTSA